MGEYKTKKKTHENQQLKYFVCIYYVHQCKYLSQVPSSPAGSAEPAGNDAVFNPAGHTGRDFSALMPDIAHSPVCV